MLDNLIEKTTSFAEHLSERERRLAIIVLFIAPLFLFMIIGRSALGYVQNLDFQINALEQQILEYETNIMRKSEVETRYAEIAKQHSSSWSEAEILDRLRAELYRLAQQQPPKLGADGRPTVTENPQFGELVDTPELSSGVLRDGGEGYKEYALNISVPRDDFNDIIDYIQRLQSSPQMLRIDRMQLSRIYTEPTASVDLDITRTVVTGTFEAPEETIVTDEAITAPPINWKLEDWQTYGCTTAISGTRISSGKSTLEALAESPEATLWLERQLDAGVYEMLVDIRADGPCRLGIRMAGETEVFSGERKLPPNSQANRYHVQFTIPEGGGPVQIPLITFETAGAKVFVENVVISAMED